MKRLTCLFLVMLLLFSGALPVSAEDTDAVTEEENQEDHIHAFQLIGNTATCGSDGIATYLCECGEEKTEPSKATQSHSYGTAEKVDDTTHKKVCTVCQKEEISAHNWIEGEVITAATCTTDGEKRFSCGGCGAVKTQKLSATGHSFDKNETNHICRNCQLQGAHVWGAGEVTKQPTCKETGTAEFQCTVCGKTRLDILEKLTTHTYDSACDPDCNVCGAKRNVSHTFATVWSKDKDGHWHECSKCGEKGDFAKHDPGPEATEERAQVCKVCSYVVTPQKKHVHSFEKEWTSDKAGHWHKCTGCKEEKDYASHKFANACDSDCDICGYKREDSHTYEDTWQTNNFEHWRICTLCGEKSVLEKHIPGPEATEQNAQLCTVCNMELKPKLDHTHAFGIEWMPLEDGHYQECTCGEQSVPEPHVWDAGKESKKGTVIYTCTKCGAEKQTEKASKGSAWVLIVLILLALICAGGIAALVVILKRGGFDMEEEAAESDEDENEFPMSE